MSLVANRKALADALTPAHGEREAAQIALLWMEHLTGWSAAQQWLHRNESLDKNVQEKFTAGSEALKNGLPFQYLVGEAWFLGRSFFVSAAVLIPRPETEELVKWVLADHSSSLPLKTVEVGTGSGCIAISLKKERPQWPVVAVDLSTSALAVAQQNANKQGTDIDFYALDFLDPTQWTKLGPTDLLISNPPYIPRQEAEKLAPHVREQEPHLALFVPNEDPLLFYKALASFSKQHLSPLGALYVEIHEDLGQNVVNLMKGYFETVILRQDLNGRDRMVKCLNGQ